MVSVVMIVVLVAGACGAAALLRRLGVPGWSVAGGILAGVILGPTIMGRVLPTTYETLFVGGAQERRTSEVQRLYHDGPATDDAGALWTAATRRHQWPRDLLAAFATALAMLTVRVVGRQGPPPGPVAPLSIGAWAAVVPGAAVLVAMRWFWSVEWPEALLVAGAVAVGPWRLGRTDRRTADDGEIGGARLIQAAGGVATAIAVFAVGAGMVAGSAGLANAWPLAVAPLAWLVPALGTQGIGAVVRWLVVPVLGACVAMRLDLISGFEFWPAVVILFACGDGRWIGALIGATVLGGRAGNRVMRMVLVMMAAGPTQLAITWVALASGLITDRWAVALLLGAVFVEVTAPLRSALERALAAHDA